MRAIRAYAGEKRTVLLEEGRHNSALSGAVETRMGEGIDWLWKSAGLRLD